MARVSKYTTVSVTTSGGTLVNQDANRVLLLVGPPLANSVTVTTGAVAPTSGDGYNLLPNGGGLEISKERHGDLVQKAWAATAATATQAVGVFEIIEV